MEQTTQDRPTTRRSIGDPHMVKMMGPCTTSTSARVDGRGLIQRTRGEGHHPQTCRQILASENAEQANVFFEQLIQKNEVRGYLDVWAKRRSIEFVKGVTERVEALTTRSGGDEGNELS